MDSIVPIITLIVAFIAMLIVFCIDIVAIYYYIRAREWKFLSIACVVLILVIFFFYCEFIFLDPNG